MQNYTNQIIIYGTNDPQYAIYPVNGRSFYECANASITRGITTSPENIEDCLKRFPEIKKITDAIGFSAANMWHGNTACPGGLSGTTGPMNLLLGTSSVECQEVFKHSAFGEEWLGCLWGVPNASYSCVCPKVNSKYEAYLKLRLNDASFWATPVQTPVRRAEFLDAIKYAKKVIITVAGDITLKIGQVVTLKLDAMNSFGFSENPSYLNGSYYITGIKHVITNSGTHEMSLSLTQIADIKVPNDSGIEYF